MTVAAPAARWTAVVIAALAAWDPAVPLPRSERPAIRVVASGDSGTAARLTSSLRSAGFTVGGTEGEAARVIVGDRPEDRSGDVHGGSQDPRYGIWGLDTAPEAPNAAIVRAQASRVRIPGQAIDVGVAVAADGLAGRTAQILLEDAGIAVASATHAWTSANERWSTSLRYLPPGAGAGRLRVRLVPLPTETSDRDNAADVGYPAMRGGLRTLVVEAGVAWPALFIRRALEGEPGFAVAALQRASTTIATRAGAPPAALTRSTLGAFEAVVVGGPDRLTAADLDALRWFVESRGGVAVFVPDQRPAGRLLEAIGAGPLEPRVLDEPVRLRGAAGETLLAAEFLVARRAAGMRVLAATAAGEPVVFSIRRGAGAVIVAGAQDAWRYRGRDEEAFARFWRRAVAEDALLAPPAIDVTVEPAVLSPGEPARVVARIRASDLPSDDRIELPAVRAHAVKAGNARAAVADSADEPVRLWPTAEPGVYEGKWRPAEAGPFTVSVAAGDLQGDAAVVVAPDVTHGSAADREGLELIARASRGQVFAASRAGALVDALRGAYPARRVTRASHPMRSPWWVAPFALLLCVEWALRRRAGQP
jgi:hypothetical protein